MNEETLNLTPKELMEVVKAILKNPDQYVSDPYHFMVDVEIAVRAYFEVNDAVAYRKVDGGYIPVFSEKR